MASSVADNGDSSVSYWANLPSLPVSEILDHLPPLDRCRFRAVCRSWKEEVPQQSIYRPYLEPRHPCYSRPQAEEPWLIVPMKDHLHDRLYFYKLSSPSLLFTMDHLPRIGLIVGKSPGGWILHVDDRGDLHALNIFTLEELHAPPMDRRYWRDEEWRISMWHHSISPDHMAIIYFPNASIEGRRYVFFLTNKKWFAWEGDKSWTKTNVDAWPYNDLFPIMIPHNGHIYAVNERLVSSFSLSGNSEIKMLDAPFLDKSNSPDLRPRGYGDFLVEISGELWMVSRIHYVLPFTNQQPVDPHYFTFTIYKLDKEDNVWREKSNFGEEIALFLDYSYSFALQTRNFPHLQPGCIYFIDNILSHHDIEIYNIDEKILKFYPQTEIYVDEKILDFNPRYPMGTDNLRTFGWMFH